MEYEACLEYMQRHCPRNVPGGLARTRRMAEILGNPQDTLTTVHIAGTNGKGSTAAMMECALRLAGYRVGLYTSPHLERYEERIQIDRIPISADTFASLLTVLIEQVLPQILAEGMAHPCEFELLTVAGWLYFAGRTDIVLSEAGLGGALDPTNAVRAPLLTVMTPISLDHCAILGDTVTAIARDKAGIFKPGVPAVTAPQTPQVLEVLRERAREVGAPLIEAEVSDAQPVTNLSGVYQRINCATALAALRELSRLGCGGLSEEVCAEALAEVYWPGRMEYIALEGARGVLLDGAHNPAGVQCLAESLRADYGGRNIVLLLSILDDKARRAMLEAILPLAGAVVLTRPLHGARAENWRALEGEIRALSPACTLHAVEDLRTALCGALEQLPEGALLCVTGSLHLVGDCRGILRERLPGALRDAV